MRHLTPADYRSMPWANGKGTTVEMLRVDRDGAMLWRLSMATVAEDGPFSLFSRVDRNLTVIDGPGFWLKGEGVDLHCAPLVPCDFAGDVAVQAVGTGGQVSMDFNVMTARSLPRPSVTVLPSGGTVGSGGMLAILSLGVAQINGRNVARHDLILTDAAAQITAVGPVIVVRFNGLGPLDHM
jgi:environmental stress-induced protein Ves